MWTRHRRRSPLRHFIMPVLATGVLSYFTYHAISGSFGLEAQRDYSDRITALKLELAELQAESKSLEDRTAMLKDGSLERDMIDEHARRLLGVTMPNEIVILHASIN